MKMGSNGGKTHDRSRLQRRAAHVSPRGEQRAVPGRPPTVSTWVGPGRAGAEWEVPGQRPRGRHQGPGKTGGCAEKPGTREGCAGLTSGRPERATLPGPPGHQALRSPSPLAAQHTSPTSSLAPSSGTREGGANPGTGSPGARDPERECGGGWAEARATCRETRAQGRWLAGAPPGSQVESDRQPPLAGAGAVSGQAAQAVVTSQGVGGLAGEQRKQAGKQFQEMERGSARLRGAGSAPSAEAEAAPHSKSQVGQAAPP